MPKFLYLAAATRQASCQVAADFGGSAPKVRWRMSESSLSCAAAAAASEPWAASFQDQGLGRNIRSRRSLWPSHELSLGSCSDSPGAEARDFYCSRANCIGDQRRNLQSCRDRCLASRPSTEHNWIIVVGAPGKPPSG